MTDDRLIYRIPEVCKILRISYATFNRRVHAGDIVVHKLGSVSIVKRESLDNFLKALPGSLTGNQQYQWVSGDFSARPPTYPLGSQSSGAW